jgi:glycosyltransferase involved in cell wall biosynthesis
VTFASELRVHLTPDGRVWTAAGFAHDYWSHFLGRQTRTTLLARSEDVEHPPPGVEQLDGPLVEVVCLPSLRPARSIVVQSLRALRTIWRVPRDEPLILRMPGIVPSLTLVAALVRRRRFCVQVVGDPLSVAASTGFDGRVARVAGLILAATTWLACRRAVAVSYVTSRYLQRRYRPGRRARTFTLPNVRLSESVGTARSSNDQLVRLVTVGSLEQRYKRVDLLIDAVRCLRDEGWNLELDVVGGGRIQAELVRQASILDLHDHVRFAGLIPRPAVESMLERADIFVLCSDTEGLPRALVEAMASGLPCIGAAVGGIPELLPAVARFERGSLDSLVATLRRFLISPHLRAALAADALDRVVDFLPSTLAPRQAEFADAVAGSPRRRRSGR